MFRNDDEKPIISRKYGISTDMYGKAFKAFQKKYVYPRNYIMTVLFFAVSGYYLYMLTSDMGNMMYWLFVILPLILTSSMWLNVIKVRHNLMTAVENNVDDIYELEVFNNGLTVEMLESESSQQSDNQDVENSENKNFQQSDNENVEIDNDFFSNPVQKSEKTEIQFGSNIVVLDREEFFLVYIIKSVFYIIPKKEFTEEEVLILQQHFKNRTKIN